VKHKVSKPTTPGETLSGISRRELIAGAIVAAAAGCAPQAQRQPSGQTAAGLPTGDRKLVRNACVLTMDPNVGDFDRADVLVEGTRIAAVQPDLEVTADAVIDGEHLIAIPGFVDTHRHIWQGALRNILPNGLLGDYTRDITGTARAAFRPEDAYIGDLTSALGAINAGVTTLLDWSHIGNTPEHTDAAIEGLRESGIRGVYAFGGGTPGPLNRFPDDIRRLRDTHFSSDDQLLTLAMAAGIDAGQWAIARAVGASITVHANGSGQLLAVAGAMGPDVTCIHCPSLTEAEWRLIADNGSHVSIACPIEMQMGHGIPPIQQALDHGIRPSLSTDVETEIPGEFFTQMRTVFSLQRMQALARRAAGEANAPDLLTVKDVLGFATVQGARDNWLEDKIGSLTPGKEADMILLRTDRINVMPVNNAYGAVVLGMDTSNVEAVFIRGRIRKWRGELVDVDLNRIHRLATGSRDYIVEAAGWPRTLLGGYLPGH
jgi:cytosine/adenosine deaminase-related metal-dependent hydrolase